MAGLIKFFLISCVILALLCGALLFTIVESQPTVKEASNKQVEHADSVNQLLAQTKISLLNRYSYQKIPLSEDQLNSLVGLLQRAMPAFNGRFSISDNASALRASYRLPVQPFTRYINLQLTVLPGKGLVVEEVKLGGLIIPGRVVLPAVVWLADWWTESEIASQFVNQVEHIKLTGPTMILTLRPLDEFLKQLNEIKNGVGVNQDEVLRIRTAHYLKLIAEMPINSRVSKNSLALYMARLFKDVEFRSSPVTAAGENEAAIMALAIYAGHHRFANFIGEVQPVAGEVSLPVNRPVLASRTDLTQHFLFSAAIKILSQQGISSAIGEFKELMDRGNGGSGFSFVDLAADMAGIQFAQQAINPSSAKHLQQQLAGNLDEGVFFPDISGLPEGLSKAEFSRIYTQVDSPEYLRMRELISERINSLPAYKGTH